MELPDLHSIHSLCRASRRVYDIYQYPQLQLRIIRSLILRTGDIRDEANIYSLLQTLKCSPRRSTLIAPTIYGMRYGGHGLAAGGRLITHIERQNALRGSLLNGDTGVSATNLLAHEGLITHDDMNLLLARCASAGYYLR
jgi:hypothetical protein